MRTAPDPTNVARRVNRPTLVIVALGAPMAVAGLLWLVRFSVPGATPLPVLMLVVVAVAAAGDRAAGILSALSAGVGFDTFFTAPYLSLAMSSREDVQLVGLLVVVGAAVTEVAIWGRRQQARASEQEGYIAGVLRLSTGAAEHSPDDRGGDDHDALAREIQRVLDVDTVTWVPRPVGSADAVLAPDGTVDDKGDYDGTFPNDRFVAIPVFSAESGGGHFRIADSSRMHRIPRVRRQAALLLADLVRRT